MWKFLQQRRDKREAIERQQVLHEKGREAGTAMALAVDAYLQPRLAQISENYLNVLRKLLEDLDHPEFTPQQMAQVQFKIFLENVQELGPKLQAEVGEHLSSWRDLADQIGITDTFNHYVKSKIDNAKLELMASAINVCGEAVIVANGNPSSGTAS